MAVQLAIAGALAMGAYHLFLHPVQTKANEVQGACQDEYCEPFHEIWVDKASHTLRRDDRPANTSGLTLDQILKQTYDLTKATFREEAICSPGVNLVAHAVS